MLFIDERYAKLSLIFCIVLLVGCATHTRTEKRTVVQQNKNEQQARQLYAQGDYQQAAILFQRLADMPSARQNVYRLQVAQSLLKIAQYSEAKGYLDAIASETLSIPQRNQLYLLYAQIFLGLGNAEQAIEQLQLVTFSSLNTQQKRNYYETSAFSYALMGQSLQSVQQRIALDSYLGSEYKVDNYSAILQELALVPVDTLEKELNRQTNGVYSGWLEMAMVIAQFPRGAPGFAPAIDAWTQKNLTHPGQELINSGYFVPVGIVLGDIGRIAVFLPESGPYASYANAIKEGFLAAYRRYEQDGLHADIQFYDTQGRDIVALYRQVVTQGVQLVIGPLSKKRIVELLENAELTVPVLALNYVEGLVKDNLYQFALSPLDEVQQAVRQATSEGHKNAIIFVPETPDGKRLSNYFKSAWEAVSGNVLRIQTYDPQEKDFSVPVRTLLNINESLDRFQKLNKTIGNIQTIPRRREDVDVIFLVADNATARLINPQFYHNRAKSVAVYGLARVYAGHPEQQKDLDLEGVSFCTIPWLFDQAYQGDFAKPAMHDAWATLPERFLSLVAFGVDAYAMLPYLNDLSSTPYYGATGDLLLNEYNRIERHLICAKFHNGRVLLLQTSKE